MWNCVRPLSSSPFLPLQTLRLTSLFPFSNADSALIVALDEALYAESYCDKVCLSSSPFRPPCRHFFLTQCRKFTSPTRPMGDYYLSPRALCDSVLPLTFPSAQSKSVEATVADECPGCSSEYR